MGADGRDHPQRASNFRNHFKTRFERSRLDEVYTEWRFSDQVQAQRSLSDDEFLIDVAIWCGTDVRDSTWMASAFFPDFEGVSGGVVQLFFVMRPDGPKLWFSY